MANAESNNFKMMWIARNGAVLEVPAFFRPNQPWNEGQANKWWVPSEQSTITEGWGIYATEQEAVNAEITAQQKQHDKAADALYALTKRQTELYLSQREQEATNES